MTKTLDSHEQEPIEDFRPRLLRLAVINILSNIMVPLAGLVDSAFLGHLPDIRHLAGVSLATTIFNYLYWTCIFLRMVTTAPTARAVGSGDRDTVLAILLRNSFIALTLGLLILLLQYPLQQIGFHLLNDIPEVKAAGQDYYNARIWDAPATLIDLVLIGWFVGRERGAKALALSVVAGGSNILLDYLFIVRWGWESTGAGAATAASQYLTLFVGLIFLAWENWLAQIPAVAEQIFQLDELKATFKLNGNLLIAKFVLVSTAAIFIDLSGYMGTAILATNSLILQVVMLAIYLIDGLALATETLVGNFNGAGANEKLPSLLRLSLSISLSIGLLFAAIFLLMPDLLFGLLTNHAETIALIHRYIIWLLPMLAWASLAYVLDGYFLGLSQAITIRNSIVGSAIVVFIPLVIGAWQLHNGQMLWLAVSFFTAARAIILGWQVLPTMKNEYSNPK